MAAATFQKEKDAAEKDELKAAIEKDSLNTAAVTPKGRQQTNAQR